MMSGFGFGMMFFGGLLFILFWVVIIGGGIWLVVNLTRGGTTAMERQVLPPSQSVLPPGQSTLDVLKMRYAKGELTKEQYDEMKRDLGV